VFGNTEGLIALGISNIMGSKIHEIEKLKREVAKGVNARAVDAHCKAGKLTARERVERLLDHGTFCETGMLRKPIEIGFRTHMKSTFGDGVVAGYGEVNGRPICVWAQDATVLSGEVGIVHGAKIVRVIERALEARVPCIGITDSEGVRELEMMTIPTNYTYDRIMYTQVKASGVIPQISLIMGPCIGAAAISAQLSDFVFMVRDTSQAYLACPREKAVPKEIGKADMHFKLSGCCDVLADGDEACLKQARELLSFLPINNRERTPEINTGDDPKREVPELLDIVPVDSRKPYDVHDVITKITDDAQFFEIRKGWATNLVVGFARFGGKACGLIANNPRIMGGCLDVDSADKLARFVRFCDAFCIPLVYLADTPAFLPGVEQERKGIIRHGSKVVLANSVTSTTQVQIYIRKCYGGGNLAMPGNNLGGDFGLAWPTSELLLMHPEGAVAIIYRKEIAAADDPREEFNKRLEQFKNAGGVKNIWESLSVQEFIDPKDTRAKLIRALKFLEGKEKIGYFKKHDNMPL
jgi:acetyl-CoA carboxylase carboxyltransferase component